MGFDLDTGFFQFLNWGRIDTIDITDQVHGILQETGFTEGNVGSWRQPD